jgi:hypothetical protein
MLSFCSGVTRARVLGPSNIFRYKTIGALPYLTPLSTIPRILAPDMVDELWGVGGELEYGEGCERIG